MTTTTDHALTQHGEISRRAWGHYASYWTTCSCGWIGKRHRNSERSVGDWHEHLAEEAARASK